MSLLLKHDWSDATVAWEEDHLQMAIAQRLKQLEDARGDFTFAAGLEGLACSSKREAGRMKLMGMRAGEVDVRVYLLGGRLLQIEVKIADIGRLLDAQKERHALLRRLGFEVVELWAATPQDAADQAERLVLERLA